MQADAMAAQSSVRDALMTLVQGGCVPWSLALPLLLSAIPFLEAPLLAFSIKDVQIMTRWLTDVTFAQECGSVEIGMHERHIKDVRLALARAQARCGIYAN